MIRSSWKNAFTSVLFLATLVALPGAWTDTARALEQHERLRVKNDFKNPEEVVKYYCARDASGFIWSGLLDIERRTFTEWKAIPQAESFLIANRYEITPARKIGGNADLAEVEVQYSLIGMSDAQGGMVPSTRSDHRVTFRLKRTGGRWKIISPSPEAISPIVLKSKFPFVAGR